MSQAGTPMAPSAPAPGAEPGLSLRWILALGLCPIAMLLIAFFGFKQLYQLWCKASGTQLRPNVPGVAFAIGQHTGRYIKVYFDATVCDGMPVSFAPKDTSQIVEVGMDGRNTYHIANLSDHRVRLRPVHYISPINASTQFGMKVCFCFNDQELAPHETREYPVIFTFSPRLDQRIHTVSLCYTLFALADTESSEALDRRIERTIGDRGGVVSPRHPPAPMIGARP